MCVCVSVVVRGSEPAESRFRNLIITYPVAIPTIPNKIARLVESSGKGGGKEICVLKNRITYSASGQNGSSVLQDSS